MAVATFKCYTLLFRAKPVTTCSVVEKSSPLHYAVSRQYAADANGLRTG